MLILLLILFFSFTKPALAAPIVSIIDFPETIIADQVFNVTFSISSATSGLNYHYKIVGEGNSEILTQPNTGCAGNYELCENINTATSSAIIATASAKLNLVSGIYNFKIRIAQSDKHTTTYNSDIVSLASILPTATPTPAPTNTPTPTNTPAPTNTPTPTKTSTPTLTPTLSPTKTPTPIFSPTPTENIDNLYGQTDVSAPVSNISITPTPEILGVSISTPDIPKPKKNYLPLVFICLGALFLLTPLIIAKIKHED